MGIVFVCIFGFLLCFSLLITVVVRIMIMICVCINTQKHRQRKIDTYMAIDR